MAKKELRILCLDDVEADAIIIREFLKSEGMIFSFDYVTNEKGYSERLSNNEYDIILADYYMPGFNGIAALLQARKQCPDVPFICISGSIGEDLAVELIQIGASDYILKDNLQKLPAAIERALHVAKERKIRKEAENEIRNMKDALEKLNIHQDNIREEERTSISREIHDQLGQALTAVKIDVDWLIDKLSYNNEEGIRLNRISRLISELSTDIRRIAAELRPPILDDLGLASAMEWYITGFEKRTGIKCIIDLKEFTIPDQKVSTTIYRIMQEALTNIARHAGATRSGISLSKRKGMIVMEVTDNGKGLEKEKIDSFKSLGFVGIRERLKSNKGTLSIKSSLGKGSTIRISIPSN
ncbi:MAG: response regulator [Bacteroidales bacterium]